MVTTAPKVVNPNQKQTGDDIFDGLNLNQLIDDMNTILGVMNNGSLVGTRNKINLIPGTDISLTITDNAGAGRVDITITSTAAGGGGSSGWNYKSFTNANATGVAWGDAIIMSISTSTTRSVPLPTAVGNAGKRIMVYRFGSGTGVTDVDGNSSETIDGDTHIYLQGDPERVVLFSDGTNVKVESWS